MAHDLDSGENGRVRYSINKGDRQSQFSVDAVSGYLAVQSPLDREMISSYVLEVQAADHGVPELVSTVLVNLDISDENDNPPLFTQSNYTAVVQVFLFLFINVMTLSPGVSIWNRYMECKGCKPPEYKK